jgi:RNA polymerase sigma factor (sigma-70 family)
MIQARPGGDTLVRRAGVAFERYQRDERAALDELVEMLTPLLWRTCRGAGLDAVTTEDVMQTVWMSLLRSADSVRDPHTIVKWLLTSARREAWRASRRSRDDRDRSGAVFGVDSEEVMDVPDQDDGPEETVFRDDRQRRLWTHVQALPERCRQLVGVIAFADKPDYAHLAESLGMPVGSIGPTRGRCLAKLRDLLAGDPHWEGQL